MTFLRNDLYCVGPSSGRRRMWRYDTTDPMTTVDDAGYFNLASTDLEVGDLIYVIVWTTNIYTGTTSSAGANGTFKVVTGSNVTTVEIAKDVAIVTLASTATPSVSGGSTFLTGGTTTITNFTLGQTGQIIRILSEHAITITDGASIVLAGSANFVMADSDTLTLIRKADSKWYELSRSVN